MPLPNVAEAVWGWGILNTIILNHKENGAKLGVCANKSLHGVPCRRVLRASFFWCLLLGVKYMVAREGRFGVGLEK